MSENNIKTTSSSSTAQVNTQLQNETSKPLDGASCSAGPLCGGRGIGLSDGCKDKGIVLRVEWDETVSKRKWSYITIEGKNMGSMNLPYKCDVSVTTLTNMINAFTMLRDQLNKCE